MGNPPDLGFYDGQEHRGYTQVEAFWSAFRGGEGGVPRKQPRAMVLEFSVSPLFSFIINRF